VFSALHLPPHEDTVSDRAAGNGQYLRANPVGIELTTGLHNYLQPITLPFSLPTRVYGVMLAIWQLRPYLQRRFPLYRMQRGDWLSFLAWCCYIGRREYGLLRECSGWNTELLEPIRMPPLKEEGIWEGSFNVAQYLIGIARARYQDRPILRSSRQRMEAARWYWREGRQCLGLESLPSWQLKALGRSFKSPRHFLYALCGANTNQNRKRLLQWRRNVADVFRYWEEAVSTTYATAGYDRGVEPVKAGEIVRSLRQRLFDKPALAQAPNIAQVEQVMTLLGEERHALNLDSELPEGINLYGYAKGELGIGEDVRSIAHVLAQQEIPFCIVNVAPGKNVSCRDQSVVRWLRDEPLYKVNLFCITGIEQTRLMCEMGSSWFTGRYNIGLWPWELPRWPTSWHHAWNQVQEIWGISQYTAGAYREAPVPVRPMPLPVIKGRVASLVRDDFGLPDDTYLFVFSFDYNSSLARKNPEGVLEAFRRAFPDRRDKSVGLVVKISHADKQDRHWRKLARQASNDDRIHIIDRTLRKSEVMALYRACNCFVSLHRAEGFGRAIAEAQLLGLDVIATGFSGNLDFCHPSSTRLVRYRLRPLEEGEYFHGEGQHWAEPDLSHAAELMRACVGKQEPIEHLTETFGIAYCGERYASRINTLFQVLRQGM